MALIRIARGIASASCMAALALAAAVALPSRSCAQDASTAPRAPDVRSLDKRFETLAAQAIPSTVLVKSTLGDGTGRVGFGSGAIVSKDGYILTCAHVVDTASEVAVTLADGRVFTAHPLGRNRKQDYALLKIEAQDLSCFDLGDSSKVALGDWVAALGHPGGPYADLRPAFSVGRVTGLHRRLPVQEMDRYYDDAIRTDAPIFAGNSGGPLVDMDGKLIGLNGAILLINEHSYAVPINEVAAHMPALRAGQEIEGRSGNALFGAMDEFEGDDLAKVMGRAGRRLFGKDGLGKLFRGKGDAGDQMAHALDRFGKSLEDKDMQKSLRDIAKAFSEGGNGEKDANGQGPDMGDLMKRLGDLFGGGPNDQDHSPASGRAQETQRAWMGVSGTPDDRGARGVTVGSIAPGGPAERAGLEANDVILSIDGQATPSGDDLARVLSARHPGDPARVHVGRVVVEDGVPLDVELDAIVTLGARGKE